MGAGGRVQVSGSMNRAQCEDICGDLFTEDMWNLHAHNGSITGSEIQEILCNLTDAFLTHDWGEDGSTHQKVSSVNKLLKERGVITWFDEEKMEVNHADLLM
jgi:hypothetical protein